MVPSAVVVHDTYAAALVVPTCIFPDRVLDPAEKALLNASVVPVPDPIALNAVPDDPPELAVEIVVPLVPPANVLLTGSAIDNTPQVTSEPKILKLGSGRNGHLDSGQGEG